MLAWQLARRWSRSRAARLALVAVVFALWVPIAVLGLMQGWIELTRQQVRAIEADLQLTADRPMPQDLPALIADHPLVAAHAPLIQTPALLTPRHRAGRERPIAVLVEGSNIAADIALSRLHPAVLHRAPALDLREPDLDPASRGTGVLTAGARADLAYAGWELMAGLGAAPLPPPPRLRSFRPGVIVGRELVYRHGGVAGALAPGTRVSIALPDGGGGLTGRINAEISDTIGSGIMEVDEVTVFVPLPAAQQLTDHDGNNPNRPWPSVDGWRLQAAGDLYQAQATLREIVPDLPAGWWQLRTWDQVQGNRVRIHEVQRNLIYLVMVLVLCLCLFVVYAAFSTVVAERRHDIGVLLALGLRPGLIVRAFYLAALRVALVGALLGWAIGWAVMSLINPVGDVLGIPLYPMDVIYAERAPISYDPLLPLSFLVIVTIIALLAATLPALRAARIDPVHTLREAG